MIMIIIIIIIKFYIMITGMHHGIHVCEGGHQISYYDYRNESNFTQFHIIIIITIKFHIIITGMHHGIQVCEGGRGRIQGNTIFRNAGTVCVVLICV